MFCTGCGTQSGESELFCGGCGNAQRHINNKDEPTASTPSVFRVGNAMPQQALPDGVRGWCWGAFCLGWIWAIGNKTWIGLLALIPYVNIPVIIWLGFNGREMAWRNNHWDSVEHFNRVQRKWSQWGIALAVAFAILVIYLVISIANKSAQETGDSMTEGNDPVVIPIVT